MIVQAVLVVFVVVVVVVAVVVVATTVAVVGVVVGGDPQFVGLVVPAPELGNFAYFLLVCFFLVMIKS